MSNKIVQLENEAGDNIYPLAGGALTGSISKTMLEEGVFEGPELSEPSSVAYVATDNIQDGAVTSDKIDWTTQTIDLTSLAVILGFENLRLNGSGSYTETIQLPSSLYPDKGYCAGAAALNSNYEPVGPATVTTGSNGQVRFRVNSSNAAIVRGQICYYTA